MTTLEKLQGRVYSGQMVTLLATAGGATLRRGWLHFRGHSDRRFTFVCEADTTTTFAAEDVIGISRTGDKITIKGERND